MYNRCPACRGISACQDSRIDDPESWIYKISERGLGATNQERAQLVALESGLLLSCSVKNDLLGFISLGPEAFGSPVSGNDLRLRQWVATRTALALEVARLTTALGQE